MFYACSFLVFLIYFALRFVLHTGYRQFPRLFSATYFYSMEKNFYAARLLSSPFIREILLNLRSSSTRIRIICRKSFFFFLSFSSCFVSKTTSNDFDDERSCIFIGHCSTHCCTEAYDPKTFLIA